MRVAFVSYDFGEYCVRTVGGLAGHAHILLCLPDSEAAPYTRLLDRRVALHTFRKPRLRHGFRQISLAAALVRAVKAFGPDVIHLQSGHLWFNFFLPLLARYPLVLTVHDAVHHLGDAGAQNTPQWILDWGCYRAGQLIVHAPQLKHQLLERLRVPADAVHVIPHVLCGDDAEEPDVDEDENLILFFGRIWEYKGLEYLIRAEPMITSEIPRARIAVAGEGADFEPYRRLMIHPERFIVLNEYVSDAMRARLFRQASVVALPYVEASQSGVVPIAYRFGKPVVATRVGGLPAAIEDGRTGYLVPPRDEKALAEAIIRLLRNPQQRREMGVRARQKINTEAAPELIAAKTLAVYQEAISAPDTARIAHQSA